MPPARTGSSLPPLIFLLHWLGGSSRTWTEVVAALRRRGLEAHALDLPGFGHAVDVPGYTKPEMASHVASAVCTLRAPEPDRPWLLVGHSMGGSVAALLARQALDGAPGLEHLAGLFLVSPSPPGPEPMKESQHAKLVTLLGASTGDDAEDRQHAASFVDSNLGKLTLPDSIHERTVADVLHMNRAAFRHWAEEGSREDLSARVGIVDLPVVLLAGSEEKALNLAAQRKHTLPHFPAAQAFEVKGAGHLSPLEQPDVLVEHLTRFVAELGLPTSLEAAPLDPAFRHLLDSPRTAPPTRAVFEARLAANNAPPDTPNFTADARATLRALAQTLFPNAPFDLAAALDRSLTAGPGNGWRFDTLPPDTAAWQTGLLSLDAAAEHDLGVSFLALNPDRRAALLSHAEAGKLGPGLLGSGLAALHLGSAAALFTPLQMKLWFKEVREALGRLYTADPRTLARLQYSGFADNGPTGSGLAQDGAGFTQIRLGEREEFEL